MSYLRIRRLSLAMKEITASAQSFFPGDYKGLYPGEQGFESAASALNAMLSVIKNRTIEMENEQSRIRAILKSMTEGILLTDTKGRVVFANPAIEKMFGTKADAVGESVLVATRTTEVHNLVMKTIESGEGLSEEIYVSHTGRLHIQATAVTLHNEKGETAGVLLSARDITKLKMLEEVRKDFVANVSHELKTPVTAIKGFTETLIDGAIDDRENALKFLETIKSNSERLNSLVDDLLALSGIELGDINIEKSKVDAGKVIDTVFATLGDKALAKGLYLKKTLPPEFSDMLADKDRLIQILLNLADNGIKFTERGGITAGIEETDKGRALYVEDTGMGIPREHLTRLGERFYRVDKARSRELGGTGLGLAIVKHLVKAHGWDMRVDSTPGKGTAVKIFFPVH